MTVTFVHQHPKEVSLESSGAEGGRKGCAAQDKSWARLIVVFKGRGPKQPLMQLVQGRGSFTELNREL